MKPAVVRVLLAFCPVGFAAGPAHHDSATWPMLQGDSQARGRPQFQRGPLKLVWRKELWRELAGPGAAIIVADGKSFLAPARGASSRGMP